MRKSQMLSKEKMKKLTTQRLLAYKNKLMQTVETPTDHYFHAGDCNGNCVWSKSHPDWQKTYNDLKAILANREHIE